MVRMQLIVNASIFFCTAWKSTTDMVADKAEEQWESDLARLNERMKQMKQTFLKLEQQESFLCML